MKTKHDLAAEYVDLRIGESWKIEGENWLPPLCHEHRKIENFQSFIAGFDAAMKRVQELQSDEKIISELNIDPTIKTISIEETNKLLGGDDDTIKSYGTPGMSNKGTIEIPSDEKVIEALGDYEQTR